MTATSRVGAAAQLSAQLQQRLHAAREQLALAKEEEEAVHAQQQQRPQAQPRPEPELRMGGDGVSGDEIITINVLGEVMAARRDTLCKVRGSFLEAMFSGRWNGALARDDAGRVFLEFNPVCFRALLDALVFDSRHPDGTAVQDLVLDQDLCRHARHHRDLCDMLEYLGLKSKPTTIIASLHLRSSSRDGLSSGGQAVQGQAVHVKAVQSQAVHGAGGRHTSVLGQEALPLAPGGSARWDIDISALPPHSWVLLGVLSGSQAQPPQPRDGSHSDAGSYGWAGRSYEGVSNIGAYVAGKGVVTRWGHFRQGDRVSLALLRPAGPASVGVDRLAMTLTRGGVVAASEAMLLPRLADPWSWFVHFSLLGKVSIQVSDVLVEV